MKAQSNPIPYRTLWAAAVALVLVGGGTVFPSPPPNELPFVPKSTTHAPAQPTLTAKALPFSLQDFASFLSLTFHMQPIESEPDSVKFIYAERQSDGRDVEIMRIMIRSREAHLQVAFSFKEFNVMNYVAEFMEGPFFTRAESEQLYELLYNPAGQASWKQVGRFQAKVTFVNGSEGMDALFEFAAAANVGRR